MTIENKEELVNETISRVVNNAPIREMLRVYNESLRAHIGTLSDEELVQALTNAGYEDLIEQYVKVEEPA
jgi:transcription initiation factor IIE alpha subunit